MVAGVVFALVHGLSYPLDTLPPRLVFGLVLLLYAGVRKLSTPNELLTVPVDRTAP